MTRIDATEGLASAQARVAQLQAMLNVGPARVGAGAGVGGRLGVAATVEFDDVLGRVDGSDGLDGKRSTGATERSGVMTGLKAAWAGGGDALGERAVTIARRYLGVPYLWGGTDPDKGLDCSGLTQLVMRQVGVDLDRTSRAQAKQGREVSSIAQAKPGDLVFFGSPVHHVGIYVGDDKILHAPKRGDDVKISTIWEKPSHIRRVLPDGPVQVSAGVRASGVTGAGADGAAQLRGPYASLFLAAGRRHGVDPALLSAVAKAESAYRPDAVSRAGARGLMQIMPGTARGLGVDPDVPEQAVDGAARLLSGYLKKYDGRVDLALAAYNAGPGAVRRHGGVPPYSETRTYIERVTGYWKDLR